MFIAGIYELCNIGSGFIIAIVPVIAFAVALPLPIQYPIRREKHAQLAGKPGKV